MTTRNAAATVAPARRGWIPFLVLFGSLAITLLVGYYVNRNAIARDELRFNTLVGRVETRVQNQMELYIALLLSGAGYFAGSESITVEEFRSYVTRLNLPRRYPGIQGVGFTARVAPDQQDELIAAMRAQGVEDFRIWPEGLRAEYHSILYLEPLDERNKNALGYDMYTDATRRVAMARARDNGVAAATGRVTLVQEIDEDVQAGFLIYVPVYAGGTVPELLEERRNTLSGFVYSPFRAGDLLRTIFSASEFSDVTMGVFDGDNLSDEHLLYESRASDAAATARADFTSVVPVNIAGRLWTIEVTSRPSFESNSERRLVPFILLAGLIVSLTLFGVTRAQVRARNAAEAAARDLQGSQVALRESEARYRALVEQSPLSTQILAADGTTMQVNRAWEKMWGATMEELEGYNVLRDEQLIASGTAALMQRAWLGETVTLPPILYHLDRGIYANQELWVEAFIYPIRDEEGAIIELVLLHQDITARRRSEEAITFLAQLSATLTSTLDVQTLLGSLAETITTAIADQCLVAVIEGQESPHPVMVVERGWQDNGAAEIEGRLARDLVDEDSLLRAAIRDGHATIFPEIAPAVGAQEAGANALFHFLLEQGATSAMIVPLHIQRRNLGLIVLGSGRARRRFEVPDRILADELARRVSLALENVRLYQEARQAVQMRDQFLSIASHELKTPITSLKGYADLLQRRATRDGGTSERDQRALQIIQQESSRLNRLIDMLLDVSRMQSGRMELLKQRVDLCALCQRLIDLMQFGDSHHSLSLLCADHDILVLGDELRLEQVIQNLISNAIKYSPEGGTVVVELDDVDDWARVRVRDRGMGIPPDAIEHLFSRFYRAGNAESEGISGMGLGLHIVRYIVEAHEGRVEVESEVGTGSTFTVLLPLDREGAG